MLNISKELFAAWNDAGLLYCHWKSNEHLLPGLNGQTDLDVLLSLDDKNEGERLLKNMNFLQCKSQAGSRYPGVNDWIGYDSETGSLIHVHLHYRLATGHKGMKEYSLLWSDMALHTRILNEQYGVYTMEPNLELITLYTRIGLKADFMTLYQCRKGQFELPVSVLKEVMWLKDRIDYNKVHCLVNTFYGDLSEEFYGILIKEKITANDYNNLRKITEHTFKKCSSVKLFRRLREIFLYVYQRWGIRAKREFGPVITKKVPSSGLGLSIAFIGQDGSGKSTVTTEVNKWLSWKLDAKKFYLGSGDEFYNPWQKRLQKKIDGRKDIMSRLLRLWLPFSYQLASAKYVRKTIKSANKYTRKGGIALFDRYPQTQFLGINDGPKIREMLLPHVPNGLKWLAKLYAAREEFIISDAVKTYPSIVFKLQLSPEESIRRRPNDNINVITRKHNIVKALEFPSSKVMDINAVQPYNEELIQIKTEIWKEILKL